MRRKAANVVGSNNGAISSINRSLLDGPLLGLGSDTND
jgi:hypothetical protein